VHPKESETRQKQQETHKMEHLIQHYSTKLEDKTITQKQRQLYEYLLDEYALLFLKDLHDDVL